jgi:tetratricopeptide (TPR) repeat protein
MLWDAAYARNCAGYNASPIAFFEGTRGLAKYPSHFTKPFPLVGEWIGRETPPTALILTQWKDLAVWSDGRKVLQADQTIPLDEFESVIRDYGATHLVAVVQKNGAREFDLQMHATMRYAFALKAAIADVEVYEIIRRSPPSRPVDASTPFRHGLSLLLSGSYEESREVLGKARGADTLNMPVRFASAVAEEFVMNLSQAKSEFAALSTMPQSLMFAREANLHRQMIERLALAGATHDPAGKADAYVRSATICWSLGYRVKARELAQRALDAESTYYPAMIFGMHFAMGECDTAAARRLFSRARGSDPENPASVNFGRIFGCIDSLRKAAGAAERSALLMRVSSAYRDLGITDAAIDNALRALSEDSSNVDAAVTLAGMYELKRRWSPAKTILTRAARIHPSEALLRERLEAVESHF